MIRNSKTNAFITFFTILIMVLSSLSVVSSQDQITDPYQELNTGDTLEAGKYAISADLQARVIQGVETSDTWSYNINAFVGDVIRFKVTILNIVDYNLADVGFEIVLPPADVLSLQESSMNSIEANHLEFKDGKIIGTFGTLAIGQQVNIQYDMEALVETDEVITYIISDALLDPQYEEYLSNLNQELTNQLEDLQIIVTQIELNDNNLIILNDELEQLLTEENLVSNEIAEINSQIDAALQQQAIVETSINSHNLELDILNENLLSIGTEFNNLQVQIDEQTALVQNQEVYITEQTIILDDIDQNIISLNAQLDEAVQNSELDQQYITSLTEQIASLEDQYAQQEALLLSAEANFASISQELLDFQNLEITISQEIEATTLQIEANILTITQLSSQYQTNQQQIETYTTELNTYLQTQADLQAEILAKQQTAAQIATTIEQQQTLYTTTDAQLTATIADLAANTAEQEQLTTLQTDIAGQVATLTENQITLQKQLADVTLSLDNTQQSYNQLVADTDALTLQKQTVSDQLQTTLNLIDLNSQELDSLNTLYQTNQQQIETYTTELNTYLQTQADLQAQILAKQQTAAQIATTIEQQQTLYTTTDAQLTATIADIAANTAEQEQLQLQSQDIATQIQTHSDLLGSKQAQLDIVNGNIAAFTQQLSDQAALVSNLDQTLTQEQLVLDDLDAQITQAYADQQLSSDLTDQLENDIAQQQLTIQSIQNLIAAALVEKAQIQQTILDLTLEKNSYLQDIDLTNTQISLKDQQINQLQLQASDISDVILNLGILQSEKELALQDVNLLISQSQQDLQDKITLIGSLEQTILAEQLELDDLETQLSLACEEQQLSSGLIDQLEADIDQQLTIIQGIQSQIATALVEKAQLEQTILDKTLERNSLAQNINLLDAQLTSKGQEINLLNLDLYDAENDLYLKQQKRDTNQLILDGVNLDITQLRDDIFANDAQIQLIIAQVDEKDELITTEINLVGVLNNQKYSEEQELAGLQEQLGTLQAEPEGREGEIADIIEQIEVKQTLIDDLSREITEKQDYILDLMSQKDALITDKLQTEEENAILSVSLTKKEQDKADYETIIQGLDDEITGIIQTISTLEEDILTAQSESDAISSDKLVLEQNLASVQSDITFNQGELQQKIDLITTLQQSEAAETQTLTDLQDQLQQTVQDLAGDNDEINGLLVLIDAQQALIDQYIVDKNLGLSQKANIESTISQLTIQASDLSDELANIIQQTSLNNDQFDQINLQVQSLQDEISSLNLVIDAKEASVLSIEDDLNLKNGLLSDKVALIDSLQQSELAETQTLTDLQAQLQQALQDLAGDNGEINTLLALKSDQEALVQNLIQQKTVAVEDYNTLSDSLDSEINQKLILKGDIYYLNQQVTVLTNQKNQLATQIQGLVDENDDLTNDKLAYEANLASLQAQIDQNTQTQTTLTQETEQLIQTAEQLTPTITTTQQLIDTLTQDQTTLEPQIQSLEAKNLALLNDKLAYEQDINALQNLISSNQAEVTALADNVASLTAEEISIQESLANIAGQIAAYLQQQTDLEPQITSLQSEADNLIAIKLAYEQDLAEIQAQIDQNTQTQTTLTQETEQLIQTAEQLTPTITTTQQLIDTLTQDQTTLEPQIQSLEAENDNLASLKLSKEADLASILQDISLNQQLYDATASQIIELQLVLDQIAGDLLAANAELDDAIQSSVNQQYISDLMDQISFYDAEQIAQAQVVNDANTVLATYTQNLNQMIVTKDALIQDINLVNTQISQQHELISQADAQLQGIVDDINVLTTTLNGKQATLGQIVTDKQNNLQMTEAINTEIGQLQAQQIAFGETISSLTSEIEEMQTDISNIQYTAQSSVSIHIAQNPADTPAELEVDKKAYDIFTGGWIDSITANVGDTIRFNISVKNTGKINDITNINVVDILPTEYLIYAGGSVSSDEPIQSSNILSWNIDLLPVEGIVYFEFDAETIKPGTAENIANASWSSPDSSHQEPDVFNQDSLFIEIIGQANHPPLANDDYATVNKNSDPYQIDVLANDTDEDEGDTIIIDTVTQPAHGVLEFDENYVYYLPDTDYVGQDQFNYTIADSQEETDTATVYLTVQDTNSDPVANDDYISVLEDSIENVIPVLSNDSDPDAGDTLTITSINPVPTHGIATISDNTILYTPYENFFGSDLFTYLISDGNGGQDSAQVFIKVESVNDAPVAENDSEMTLVNTSVDVDVLLNDHDVESNTLTITDIVSNPENGTASIVEDFIRYEPEPWFIGFNTIVYEISDGNGGTDTATLTIQVYKEYVNHPPEATDDYITVYSNTSDNIINVLENDEDIDGDPLNIAIQTSASNGSAIVSENVILFTPDPGFYGEDSFTYNLSDGTGGYDVATVTVTVENQPQIISKPESGSLYIINQNMGQPTNLLSIFGIDAIIIGPITIQVEVNETQYFDVERVEFYIDGDLSWNTTEKPYTYIINEKMFGIYPIKVIAYGAEETLTQEINVMILNFGLSDSPEL